MEPYKSHNKTQCTEIFTLARRPMCPQKTTCRHMHSNMHKLSTSSVAFSACSCQQDSVKTENKWVQRTSKLPYNYVVYLSIIILCSCLNVVIAVSDHSEGLEHRDSTARVTPNIPIRTKGK